MRLSRRPRASTRRSAPKRIGRRSKISNATAPSCGESRPISPTRPRRSPPNRAQIERDQALMPLLQERYEVAKGLYDKHYGPKPPVLDAEQQKLERKSDLASAESTAGQIAAQTRSLEAKRAQTEAAFLADAL